MSFAHSALMSGGAALPAASTPAIAWAAAAFTDATVPLARLTEFSACTAPAAAMQNASPFTAVPTGVVVAGTVVGATVVGVDVDLPLEHAASVPTISNNAPHRLNGASLDVRPGRGHLANTATSVDRGPGSS